MLVVLLILWIVFNGRLTLEIVAFGVIFSVAVFIFMKKFMDYSIDTEKNIYRLMPKLLAYLGLLVVEIIKSSLALLPFVLGKKEPQPLLVKIRTPLKTDFCKVLLANSITLTPGTITENVKENMFRIHCLDRSMAEGIENCSFVKALVKMEEVMIND